MATVSDEGMTSYLEAFHETYRSTVKDRIPADLRDSLARERWLSHGLVGYISTQFGAGFEYVTRAGIFIRKGSRRIEDLVFDAPGAVRGIGPMIRVGGANSGVAGVTIDGAFPVRLSSEEASVKLVDLRARAGRWQRTVEWAELYGDRSAEFWSVGNGVRRALEEVLVAVVDARQMEQRQLDLGDFLIRFRERRVLLLGDFANDRERLRSLSVEVEQLGYLPILADEIPDIRELDLRQKILMLSLACRFVIIEDSVPAGQMTEIPLVEFSRAVVIVLRRTDSHSSWMTQGVSATSNVILEREYDDGNAGQVLGEGVAWAEQQIERLGRHFDDQLPWRTQS
ncbi:MAG: hypothetical protein ABSH29_27135 [Acidimicrobiales bacterium]|jgi:hypothetical protein